MSPTRGLRYNLSMIRKPPFSGEDFTLLSEDTLPIRFGKTVCKRLQELGVPEWVTMGKVFCADAGSFHTVHGGPTLSTPVSKLNHIHYIYPSHMVVGFQYEANYAKLPTEIAARWSVFQSRLRAATGVDYTDIARVRNWPRLQFRYNYKSLQLADVTERRLLIDNTKTALEVAGEVFGW